MLHFLRCFFWLQSTTTEFLQTAKKPEISQPFDPVHLTHVGFNSSTGEFTGLPKEWQQLLQESGISRQEQERNPQAVMEIVKFYQEGRGEWDKMGNMNNFNPSGPTHESVPGPLADDANNSRGFNNPVRFLCYSEPPDSFAPNFAAHKLNGTSLYSAATPATATAIKQENINRASPIFPPASPAVCTTLWLALPTFHDPGTTVSRSLDVHTHTFHCAPCPNKATLDGESCQRTFYADTVDLAAGAAAC